VERSIDEIMEGGVLIVRLLTFLLLLLLILFAFRTSIARTFRTWVIVTLAFLGSLVFATIVARQMGGGWGLVGLLTAFIFLVPLLRRLLHQMCPPREKTQDE
jgi:Zn-dependent protease